MKQLVVYLYPHKYVITIITIVTIIKLYNQCKENIASKVQFKLSSKNPVKIYLVMYDKTHVMLGNHVVIHGKSRVKRSLS